MSDNDKAKDKVDDGKNKENESNIKNKEKLNESDRISKKEDLNDKEQSTKTNKETKEENESKEQEEETEEEEEEIKATVDVIQDIMDNEEDANRAHLEQLEGPKKFTKKRKPVKPLKFSFGNMDLFLHTKYVHVNPTIRYSIELFLVSILFMVWPVILVIIHPPIGGIINILSDSSVTKETSFFKENLFFTLSYMTFTIVSLITDKILYISAIALKAFEIKIEGIAAEFLQILQDSRTPLRNSIVSIIIWVLSNKILKKYEFFAKHLDIHHIIMTFVFWYGILSIILFCERFIMNIFTSEIRRSSFRGRIWDTNYKTFIIKKFYMVSEAHDYGRHEEAGVIKNTKMDYDTGFFLRYNDLDLSTAEAAKGLAESVFGYLEIIELEYELIQYIFPDNPEEIQNYLHGSKIKDEDREDTPISFELFENRCVELQQERVDIARSLYDRDNLLRKLDYILVSGCFFFGIMILFFLFDFDYKIYIASVGPAIFGFGWIFQDTIKDLYSCFVFHLFSHPYDCGDWVVINGQTLLVSRIDLMYTTFMNELGRVAYIPNTAMFSSKIDNIRRSDIQSHEIEMLVDHSTTLNQIDRFKEKMRKFLLEHTKEFTGKIIIEKAEMAGALIKITMIIEHNSNFQEINLKIKRRDMLIEAIEKILSKAGITHEPAIVVNE
ncbi:Mechanosensitive ion channel protein Msy1 [Astathelohania contejeani]|uniref:Mechanosensitive ion channel protein Msy1 n=1 Tax=Astathelohania contejeani TaxID=164912 RepID=A0ABQ7I1P0_9MICR|nr:Mechanosensitive ion channel protein Msy1 [Thelohania contejeani]